MSVLREALNGNLNVICVFAAVFLVGVLGFFTWMSATASQCTFKGDLDATCLTLFVRELRENLEDQDQQGLGLSNHTPARGVDLLLALARTKPMRSVRFELLAGATGQMLKVGEWNVTKTIDTTNDCVFTCPADTSNFLRLVSEDAKSDEIFMCYNRNTFDKYPELGMVIFVAGDSKARFVAYLDIPDEVDVRDGTKLAITPGRPDFFGKHPFAFVAPE